MGKNQLAGIYKITNTFNNKNYVGSAINIKKRWNEHKRSLKRNDHHSRYLQRSWNKYGKESFAFEIIEIVYNKENLINREQYWINELKSYNRNFGYNLSPTAGSILGYKMSEETKKKMSDARKGRGLGNKLSEETRRKISESKFGLRASEATKKKLSELRTGKNHPLYGKSRTNETKKKISESNIRYYENNIHPMSGRKHTDETKNKMKENHADFKGENGTFYGKSHTEATKKKMSEAKIGKYIGERHPLYGKNHKEASKQKMSEARKGIYFGENHPNSKVTELVVKEIRRLYEEENIKIVDLTKIFNFKRSMIDKIVKYETWKY